MLLWLWHIWKRTKPQYAMNFERWYPLDLDHEERGEGQEASRRGPEWVLAMCRSPQV